MTKTTKPEECQVITSFCSSELTEQLQSFLGSDFTISSLSRYLGAHAPFKTSRGIVRSFSTDMKVIEAQNATFRQGRFTPRCEVDTDDLEVADYRTLSPTQEDQENRVAIRISPNALKAAFKPVKAIYDTRSPLATKENDSNDFINTLLDSSTSGSVDDLIRRYYSQKAKVDPERSRLRNEALNITYTGVFASVVARYAIEQHIVRDAERIEDKEKAWRRALVDTMYSNFFQDENVLPETKLHRIAMAVGGTVMFRYLAESIGFQFQTNPVHIGGYLKLFKIGISATTPPDEKPVSFSMAHSLRPSDAKDFFEIWFSQTAR